MLNVIDMYLGKALRCISIVSLAVLFLLLSGNVFFRFVPVYSFGWFDEIVELFFVYFVFFGAAALFRINEHFIIDLIPNALKGKLAGRALMIGIEIVNIAFFLILMYFSLQLTLRADDQSPIFKLSKRWFYGCMPLTSLIMFFYSIRNLVRRLKNT